MWKSRQIPLWRPPLPDEDDDGRSLGHGANHAAGADDAEEDEEGLLAAGTGAFPWAGCATITASGDTSTARQILQETR